MRSLLCFLMAIVLHVSCSQDGDIDQEVALVDTQTSSSLRVALEKFRENAQEAGRRPVSTSFNKHSENGLCFQFVYPITLSYNDNSQVVVADYEQLLEVILSETLALHITGIAYPFSVDNHNYGMRQTISGETAFQALLENCGYQNIDFDFVIQEVGTCFNINYPVTLIVNDAEVSFSSQEDVQMYFMTTSGIESISVGYPLRVTLVETSVEVMISDDYELIYLIKDTCAIK